MKRAVAILSIFSLVALMVPYASTKAEGILSLMLPGIGTVTVTDEVVEPFDALDAWENYSSPRGVELGVENGIYRVYAASPGYIWGLNALEHTDVVAEVEVTPLTPFTDIGAGVMCRADTSNNGDGYYFMINANGYYSIQVGDGDNIVPLVDWQQSRAVNAGIDRNVIRAVCLGDQLAMYVNDELVASIVDSTFTSGFAGLAVAAGNNGVDMSFDNVNLYSIQTGS